LEKCLTVYHIAPNKFIGVQMKTMQYLRVDLRYTVSDINF